MKVSDLFLHHILTRFKRDCFMLTRKQSSKNWSKLKHTNVMCISLGIVIVIKIKQHQFHIERSREY